ncbi:60S ribosomal protein L13, partial [Trichonephila inaurata madagascariensis]
AANINRKEARTIGISVDYRRKNKSVESLQQNVHRLKVYKSKLILFPRISSKNKKGEATAEEIKMATQLKGVILPIKHEVPLEETRKVTDEEKAFKAFKTVRKARVHARTWGIKQKKAKEEAESLEAAPKKAK